ncbi:PREDICTED: protein BCL9 homolog isoform X2 [Nicrophorus vespilloides]|uniref:Protein BCL9 homolog isoform X2 n=1 Tax=Nicrophorus vespilloides TaxID=110193 RepID=A0ABM1N2H7_NICVS|nr:PREDICTED: protein BCL9 homolog isoform X2 [Nicrophorus vespilloides]
MIKEKHEKGSDGVKEEPGSSDKDSPSSDVRVKKEDDPTSSNVNVKKESGRPVTKNGGVIGSTNLGSLHGCTELKTETEDTPSTTDTSNAALKEEIDPDIPRGAFSLNLPSSAPVQPPDGVQPLASNVINKQPSSMEVQYMQQQSQIFVFSTVLANSGAEEVIHGRFPSIIAYHCAQPGTKKYLEKNPLKITQFNRQNPAQWLNSVMKNNCKRSPGIGPKSQPSLDNFLGPEGLEDMVGLGDGDMPWDQKNNHQLESLDSVSNGLPDVPDMDSCSPSLANVQPSLQGVKVPDKDLTPQQRQHREVQLSTLRKMQEMLFPEATNSNPTGTPTSGAPTTGPPPVSEPIDMPSTMISGSQAQSNMPGPGPQNPGNMMHSNMDWPKMQQNYFDKGKPIPRAATATGPRLQGPPPPYHQTPRSASVPIALQSPSPASPNNPTSNLSLPSPRASSALNSPADSNRPFGLNRHMSTGQSPTSQDSPSRHNHSNPGTPVSSHLSPSVTTSTSETTTHARPGDNLFTRTLQSIAKEMMTTNPSAPTSVANTASKEPNLMPVPSPQQIQYLNTFEGQELIIQKQPNTSLNKEGNMISPPGFPGNSDMAHNRVSGPNTPTSIDVGPRFPGTPSDGCRFQVPSPHTPTAQGDKPSRLSGSGPGLSPQTSGPPLNDPVKSEMYPSPTPHMMDVTRFPGPSASPGTKMGNFVNVSPSGKSPLDMPNYGCGRGDNVPLNPNCTSTMSGNPKVSHFDPISSLAQMSQQLTNSVASSLNGQGNPGSGMMNFGSPSMHMMDMGGCHGMGDMDQASGMMGIPMQGPPHGFHANSPMGPLRSLSPKLQGAFPNHMPMPRMMGRPPGPNPYNGANVQVKPNAPNTIQYMPAKSQVGNAPGPRGPPSLEFLRFTSPLSNIDNKMPSQNLQYFPNCGPNSGPMAGPGGPMSGHMGHMDGPPMQDGPMGVGPMMGAPMGNGPGPMMGPSMGMPGGMMPMMRPMRPPPGMIRMPQMGFNGPPNNGGPGGDGMFNPGPPNMPNPNSQMFVSGSKGSPMGMGAPDASQPLPPSMGQSNSFKNSPFVGPTTADPNYAQQFHNFQQQLYATTTRSQMGGQAMGPGPGPPHTQQPPYYNPK